MALEEFDRHAKIAFHRRRSGPAGGMAANARKLVRNFQRLLDI
jgi:hypothetical protein